MNQETQRGDILNRAELFYADLEESAYREALKVSQDLNAVILIGENKQELKDVYRQLKEIELWFLSKGQGWLNFWRFEQKSFNRTVEVLLVTLFDVLAPKLGMPPYDTLRTQYDERITARRKVN